MLCRVGFERGPFSSGTPPRNPIRIAAIPCYRRSMPLNWNFPRPGPRRKPIWVLAACFACACFPAGCGKKDEPAQGKAAAPAKSAKAVSAPVSANDMGTLVLLHGEMRILPGMKVSAQQKLELKEGIVTTSSPGGNLKGHIRITDTERWRVEYISENEKRVVLDEKQAAFHMETGGAEPLDTDATSVLEGRELTALRRKDGHWWFGLSEGEPEAEAVNELVDLGKREALATGAYPKEPRALGESWECPLDFVAGLLGSTFQASEGTLTMRLERLSSFEGQRCAEIGVTLKCSGTYVGTGSPMAMNLELIGSILRSLNAFQDLKITLEGPLTLQATPEVGTEVSIGGNVHFSLENHVTRE